MTRERPTNQANHQGESPDARRPLWHFGGGGADDATGFDRMVGLRLTSSSKFQNRKFVCVTVSEIEGDT
jgi:hypothetical protein